VSVRVDTTAGEVLAFIAVGVVSGWIAGALTKGKGFGLAGNLVVGILGAIFGGILFSILGLSANNVIGSIVMSVVGAVVLLLIFGAVLRKR